MDRITVVGAGIAGLTAAISCAEQGAPVLHATEGSLGAEAAP